VIVAALAAVVLAFWGMPRLWGVFDDGMRGPYGQFPGPVAAQPPMHSAQRVATSRFSPAVYRGLAIMRGDDGVRAVDIVTGRVYWRYTKDEVVPKGIDRSTGDVFLQTANDELVKINIRSGKIFWTQKMPDLHPDWTVANYSVLPVADAATLAITGDDGIAGISSATGKILWSKKWPSTCPYDNFSTQAAVMAGTLAFTCNVYEAPDKALVGFDPATGATRWTLHASQLLARASRPADRLTAWGSVGGRLAVAAGDTSDLIDPATGRIVARWRWKDQDALTLVGGLQISECSPNGPAEVLCGYDLATGRKLWRIPIPDSGHLPGVGESLAVIDGRVYAEVENYDAGGVFEFVVFDGRTGHVLNRFPHPDHSPSMDGITDGVIINRTEDGFDLYAERPDIRNTRRL
jgi:outer membrane protein assembly factor BamB